MQRIQAILGDYVKNKARNKIYAHACLHLHGQS